MSELLSGVRYADRNPKTGNIFLDIENHGWISYSSTGMYLHYSLGEFSYGIEAAVSCAENKVGFGYTIRVDDVFDFENTNSAATPNSVDAAWHRMQRVGLAQHFKVEGSLTGFFSWDKGNPPVSFN